MWFCIILGRRFTIMFMLNIDPHIFKNNLLLTQLYCDIQMSNMVEDDVLTDVASVFRSINPEIAETEIYEYGIEEYRPTNNIKTQLIKSVRWTIDPITEEKYIDELFPDQMLYKEKCLSGFSLDKQYQGEIIISQVDFSVVDGASAAESYYLFDDYDLPPIDTWFYLMSIQGTRLLFAWIPDKYISLADDAITVNCVDCISRFKRWHEPEYMKYYKLNLSHLPLK